MTYYGTTGNDTQKGAFDLYGGDGNDRLGSYQAGVTVVDGGNGDDYLWVYNNMTIGYLFGGAGNDVVAGYVNGDALYGGAGNDLLTGGGVTFWPTITDPPVPMMIPVGASGDDVLFGGAGVDGLYGFDGNDTIYGDSGNDNGQLIAVPDGSGTGSFNIASGIYGGDGNDHIYARTVTGTASGNDLIYGGTGDDYVDGGSGSSTVYGGDGNDSIDAGYGLSTTIYGGDGNDTLTYFGPHDVDLIGGAGNDFFDCTRGSIHAYGGDGGGPGTGIGHDTFSIYAEYTSISVLYVEDWTEGLDHVQIGGVTSVWSFGDLLSASYQEGTYLVVHLSDHSELLLHGATAGTITAADFSF